MITAELCAVERLSSSIRIVRLRSISTARIVLVVLLLSRAVSSVFPLSLYGLQVRALALLSVVRETETRHARRGHRLLRLII